VSGDLVDVMVGREADVCLAVRLVIQSEVVAVSDMAFMVSMYSCVSPFIGGMIMVFG